MKLLDILSKKEVQENSINPVNDTAKDCLINLVRANSSEAILLNNELHFTKNEAAGNAISKGTVLFQEIRYQFVNHVITQSGIKNVLDIGCGYSPRGLLLGKQGYHYIGCDLPATIKELEPSISKIAGDAYDIAYMVVDATNPGSILDAANKLDGPVCIVSEGLFMYFPPYELNEYLKGLKAVLEAKGGFIITPDFCMNKLFQVSMKATSFKFISVLLQKIAGKIVKEYTIPSKSKMDPSNWYAKEDDTLPFEYFTSKGFMIERIPLYDKDIHLNTLSYVKHSKKKQFIEDYKNIYGWKITVK